MIVLDVAGSGLFSGSSQFMHVVGDVLKLIGGSVLIVVLSITLFIWVVVRSVYIGISQSSILDGISTLIRYVAYVIGLSIALLFVLITTTFFSISSLKVMLVAAVIVFVVAFIARETFLFVVIKRFGKYIFYLTTLHQAGKAVYHHVKTENNHTGESQPPQAG